MGTSNFHNVNASKIYAILEDSESMVSDFIHTIDNIQEDLKEKGYKEVDEKAIDELRAYPARVIAEKTEIKTIENIDLEISITICAVVRSGYYEGFNLDWYIVYSDSNNYNLKELDIETIFNNNDYEFENKEKEIEETKNWIENTKNNLIKELEEIYESISTSLVVTARFSNGETIYEKANNN
jgi:hypothetical protein